MHLNYLKVIYHCVNSTECNDIERQFTCFFTGIALRSMFQLARLSRTRPWTQFLTKSTARADRQTTHYNKLRHVLNCY